MRGRVIRRLRYLRTAELGNVVLVPVFLGYVWTRDDGPVAIGVRSAALGLVCLILLQGGVYWHRKLAATLGGARSLSLAARKGFRRCRLLNPIAGGVVMVVAAANAARLTSADLAWTGGLLLLAALEHVNYYHWQLMHDTNADLRRLVRHGIRRASLASEIDDAKDSRWWPEFAALLALLVLTRVADGMLTYAITPDLAREANPVASVFGAGWTGLIAVAALLTGAVMWMNYRSLVLPIDNFPAGRQVPFAEFRARYFDVRANPLFAERPGAVLIYVCGYVFPRAIIVWSVLLLAHNALVLADASWYRPLRELRLSYLLYLALPLLSFVFIALLQRRDYARYAARGE